MNFKLQGEDSEPSLLEEDVGGLESMLRLESWVLHLLQQITQVASGSSGTFATSPGQLRFLHNLLRVAACIHTSLHYNKTINLREVFYAQAKHFQEQRQTDHLTHILARTLHCSRRSLNIVAAPRGIVAGNLEMKHHKQKSGPDAYGPTWLVDERLVENFAGGFVVLGSVRYVVVVEKESVFNLLVQERFTERLPSILITGKGYPDLLTRQFLQLIAARSKAPIVAICDFNPDGIGIALTFQQRHSLGQTQKKLRAHGQQSQLCRLKWAGLLSSHLEELGIVGRVQGSERVSLFSVLKPNICRPFSMRDWKKLLNLAERNESKRPNLFGEEIEMMRQIGHSVEIQAVQSECSRSFSDFWISSILSRNWIEL